MFKVLLAELIDFTPARRRAVTQRKKSFPWHNIGEKATSYLMCNDHTQIANSARLSLPFSTCLLYYITHGSDLTQREKPTLFGNVIGLGNESVLWIPFTFPFFVGLLDNIPDFDNLTRQITVFHTKWWRSIPEIKLCQKLERKTIDEFLTTWWSDFQPKN